MITNIDSEFPTFNHQPSLTILWGCGYFHSYRDMSIRHRQVAKIESVSSPHGMPRSDAWACHEGKTNKCNTPSRIYGRSPAIWLVYGLYMACIWLVYGLYMACIWLVYPNGVRIGQASIDWCCEHNQLGQIWALKIAQKLHSSRECLPPQKW